MKRVVGSKWARVNGVTSVIAKVIEIVLWLGLV